VLHGELALSEMVEIGDIAVEESEVDRFVEPFGSFGEYSPCQIKGCKLREEFSESGIVELFDLPTLESVKHSEMVEVRKEDGVEKRRYSGYSIVTESERFEVRVCEGR